MRKKWIGFLMALLVVFLGCSGSGEKAAVDPAKKEAETVKKEAPASKKPLIDDFRGIKWFTKRSEIPGFSENFANRDYSIDGGSTWTKKDENKSLGDIPLTEIVYVFCGDKKKGDDEFCGVKLDFDSSNFDNVSSFLNASLGTFGAQNTENQMDFNDPRLRTKDTITTAKWDLPSLRIEIRKLSQYSSVTCEIWAKKEKSKTGGGL